MSWKKAGILLVCVAVIVSFFVADGLLREDAEAKKSNKIIYIYKTTQGDVEFWNSITDGIHSGARQFGYEFSVLGARDESDIDGNIEALHRAASLNPDAIVLSAASYELLAPAAQKVADQGILLVTMDSDVAGDISRCYIGTDNFSAGVKMAQELQKRIPDTGRVAVVGHVKESLTAQQRIQGAVSVLEADNSDRVIDPVYCDNKSSIARDKTINLLKAYPDIQGIIATNENSANGVGEALVMMEMQDKISVIGCDNSSQQISYLEQGVIDATIVQNPFSMGYFSVKIVDQLLKGDKKKEIGSSFYTDTAVITLENYFTTDNQKLLFPLNED